MAAQHSRINMKKYSLIGSILLIMISCNNNDRIDIEFSNVEQYGSFNFREKGTTVIKNIENYNALWDIWNSYDGNGKTPLPIINFDSLMVIAVHYGGHYSGCTNSVEVIKTIETDHNEIYITIESLPDLGPCDAVVFPLHMVQLEYSEMNIIFEGDLP